MSLFSPARRSWRARISASGSGRGFPRLSLAANLKNAPVEGIEPDPPGDRGVVIEGCMGGARRYVNADAGEENLPGLLDEYPDRAVFIQSEIEALKGAGSEEGEIVAMVKEVFPGAVVVESIKIFG